MPVEGEEEISSSPSTGLEEFGPLADSGVLADLSELNARLYPNAPTINPIASTATRTRVRELFGELRFDLTSTT